MNILTYRDGELFQQLCQKMIPFLQAYTHKMGRKFRFMEVCGTHTVAFSKTGVREILAPYVDLVSGPGCPVCVTAQTDMDQMIAYAKEKDVIVATFGDMMRVPGSDSDLSRERADGADVRVVYSASGAVEIASQNPKKQVVFLGVGFETTAPGVALAIQKASRERIKNFFVFSAHKLTPPAVRVLINDSEHQLDGFLLPGHVSVIIGRAGWTFLEESNQTAVIGGFEPIDLLTSIYLLATNMMSGKPCVLNHYPRIVREKGNQKAQAVLHDVFQVAPATWRGFGEIPQSGLAIHKHYRSIDATETIPIQKPITRTVKGCRCGEVIKGKETPFQCRLFGTACTPEKPIGPCMVSSEGTCATYYLFEEEKELVKP
ncbi:hydrogenase formation protein HypD [Brevibacillus massiliensis]|uniref:hydrogenase formation protein HypD n=1 Tax=Brevibacillus massiliensis TaxID=1118054 RepID=UPI0002F9A762|nr:hydrogenase formation protein HypD [Brevibacillus massiliensis]